MFITYLANAPLNASGIAASLDVLLLRASRMFSVGGIMAEKPSNVKQRRFLSHAWYDGRMKGAGLSLPDEKNVY